MSAVTDRGRGPSLLVWAFDLYKNSHTFVGFAASLVGLGAVPVMAVKLFSDRWAQNIQAAFVCVVALGCVALALYIQHRFYEERRAGARSKALALAMPAFVRVHEHTRNAAAYASEHGDHDRLREEARNACQAIATLFSAVTGAHCRVTVKLLYRLEGDTESAAVRDLFRSEPSYRSGQRSDPDLVERNTDFDEVLTNGLRPWRTSDILRESGYQNSHITREELARGEVPYRSVLVSAIYGHNQAGQPEIRGFLCLDSATPGVFDDLPDVSLVVSCAHAFYSILTWIAVRESMEEMTT